VSLLGLDGVRQARLVSIESQVATTDAVNAYMLS